MKVILSTILLLVLLPYQVKALSCGDQISHSLTMTENLHCPTGEFALEVIADNVLINMNGYTISGTRSTTGIKIFNHKKVKIYSGVIKGFWAGLNIYNSNSFESNDVTYYDLGEGIALASSKKAQILNNDFLYIDSRGIAIINNYASEVSYFNNMAFNQFYKNRIGIELCGGNNTGNTMRKNFIWNSIDYGINIKQSNSNIIESNDILNSQDTAIRMTNSNNNKLRYNSLRYGVKGLTVHASKNTACSGDATNSSKNNWFNYNHSIGFETGVILGIGIENDSLVYDNLITENKLYDDDTGVFLNTDAHHNDLSNNAYYGTTTPIVDEGTTNNY